MMADRQALSSALVAAFMFFSASATALSASSIDCLMSSTARSVSESAVELVWMTTVWPLWLARTEAGSVVLCVFLLIDDLSAAPSAVPVTARTHRR